MIAREVFESCGLDIGFSQGERYLGGFIGSQKGAMAQGYGDKMDCCGRKSGTHGREIPTDGLCRLYLLPAK